MLDFPSFPFETQLFTPSNVRGVFAYGSGKWRMLPGLRPVYSVVNYSGTGFIVPLPMGFSAFQIKVAGFNPAVVGSLLMYCSLDNTATWKTDANYVAEGVHSVGSTSVSGSVAEAAQAVTAIYLSGAAYGVYGAVAALPSTYDMWFDPGASTPALVHSSWLIRYELFDTRNFERAGLGCGYLGHRGRVTDLWVLTNSSGTFSMDSFDCLGVVE